MSNSNYSGPEVPQKKSKQSCLVWGIVGCGGLIVLAAAAAAGLVFFVFKALKNNDVYRQALTMAQEDSRVQEAMGTPIVAGFMVSGNINVENGSGEADFSFPISGPESDGEIHVTATKSRDTWTLTELIVDVASTSDSFDLLEGDLMVSVKQFFNAARAGDYATAHSFFSGPLIESQDIDQFSQLAADNGAYFEVKEFKLTEVAEPDGRALRGTVVLERGDEVPASFVFIKEDGTWRFVSYNIGRGD